MRQKGSDRPNIDGDHIELVERAKHPEVSTTEARSTGAHASSSSAGRYSDWERDNGNGGIRKGSIGGILGDGLKKRLSIRKKKDT